MRKIQILIFVLVAFVYVASLAQTPADTTSQHQKNLYVVGTSHLDTQWRWTIQNTINEYVPATFRDNFKLMDLYPDYVFSFEGAFKYMILKEYYPDLYARLKPYIDRGQWRVAGSWVDAVDVNMPSFESLVRQTLYGNGYFKQEFGKTSKDIFLPDCFGFGYALPSVAAHCGLKSFSTQKLSWGSAYGVPFDIGFWEGVDGSKIVAALNPGAYVTRIRSDLSRDTTWLRKINQQGANSCFYGGYMYFGTGDTGGSPDSESVAWLDKSMKSDGPIKVKSIGSDGLVDEMEQYLKLQGAVIHPRSGNLIRVELPHYKGELLMTRHGTGCYTSEAAMKRWNRKNELLADATERASVIAAMLGGFTYPKQELKDTWIRFLWHQFHDDLTGTSIPEAYQFSWNDEILCQNRFAGMLENAVAATTQALYTRVEGTPIVVYNSLSISREDIVQAKIPIKDKNLKSARVYSFDTEVPSQIISSTSDSLTVLFIARVEPVGYAVYDIRQTDKPCELKTELKVSANTLENKRYLIKLNDLGQVTSIFDKFEKRELLSSPISLQLLHDKPGQWPAWEIQYEDIMAEPQAILGKNAKIEIVENGPARVALKVTQKTDKSEFNTIISLAAGDAGNRIEFNNEINWYEREMLLKAAFKLTVPNDSVTYDIGLGTISRGINHKELYEVPGQQWADMTAKDNSYGVAVLNDCKYGWDHPDTSTLRLSLIHTPGVYESWNWVGDQKSQDNGHHKFKYAVYGHKGDWRDGDVPWQAARLNQPLMAFVVPAHDGKLANDIMVPHNYWRGFSLVRIGTIRRPSGKGDTFMFDESKKVMINSIKMCENSDELILRIRELYGKPTGNLAVSFGGCRAKSIREINGMEETVDSVHAPYGELTISLGPYQTKVFAFKFEAPERPGILILTPTDTAYQELKSPQSRIISLPFNQDGISLDSDRKDGDFDGEGGTLAGDLMPDTIIHQNIPFVFGPRNAGALNIVSCKSQNIVLPSGEYNRLYILATAVGGPAHGTFSIDSKDTSIWIQDYAQNLGQWNSRLVGDALVEEPDQIAPEYINREPVAWVGTHRHNAKGENEAYQFTYLYLVKFDMPPGSKILTLPNNPNIKILAATAVKSAYDNVTPTQPLYDVANATLTNIHADRHAFIDSAKVTITCPNPGAEIHYTVDNSAPTTNSPRYIKPFFVNATATVKSRAFLPDADDHFVALSSFNKLIPHEAVLIKKAQPGLSSAYYEGHWDKLPNFDSLTVKKVFVANSVSIPDFSVKEDFGLTFDGYIKIPTDGLYDFYLSSDDGSDLFIGDSLVIDNDGLHGEGDVLGEIALKAGYHPISIHMFQAKGDEAMAFSMQGPGIEKRVVPKEILFH
jgi:alpha-mannosidase